MTLTDTEIRKRQSMQQQLRRGQAPDGRRTKRPNRLKRGRSKVMTGRATKPREKKFIKKTIPGTPGVKSPTIDPFMEADDMLAYGEARDKLNTTVGDLDYQLQTQLADNEYERSEIDRAAVASRTSASDEFAGRGLFHSSIRDAELFDIDATAGIRKTFLDRSFDTLAMDSQRRKLAAKQAFDEFQQGMNQKMVENARKASEGMPEYIKDPVPDSVKRVRNPDWTPRHQQRLRSIGASRGGSMGLNGPNGPRPLPSQGPRRGGPNHAR